MSDLHSIKQRINSIKSTKKITDAMKMVSTVKLWKLEDNLQKNKIYHHNFESIFKIVSANAIFPISQNKKDDVQPCFIVLGSDRGMCGAYNTNIVKLAQQVLSDYLEQSFFLIGVGKRVILPLAEQFNFDVEHINVWDDMDEDFINNFASFITDNILNGKFSTVTFIYNNFKTAVTQIPVVKQVYPLQEKDNLTLELFDFQPVSKKMLQTLFPKYLKSLVEYHFAEAETSEYASRMTSMGNASRNAEELLSDLQILYNKARQSKITIELMEIISGSEAQK